jgi:hypothetical protein
MAALVCVGHAIHRRREGSYDKRRVPRYTAGRNAGMRINYLPWGYAVALGDYGL